MRARTARRIRTGIEAANAVARTADAWTFWHMIGAQMPGSLFDNDALTLKAYMARAHRLYGSVPSSRMRP